MGYKAPGKVFVLRFADGEHEGLVVRVKSLPIGQFLPLMQLSSALDSENPDYAGALRLFEVFADCLVSWNLTDEDDNDVPADLTGVNSLDLNFGLDLVKTWLGGIATVPAPLAPKSPAGSAPGDLASLPRESL